MNQVEIAPADIIRNARKAYDEGRLQAQTGKTGEGSFGQPLTCSYVQDCAIGVSVRDKGLAQEWDNAQNPVSLLVQDGKITYPGGFRYSPADKLALAQLQDRHDAWAAEATRPKKLTSSAAVHSVQTDFYRTLSDLERRYEVTQF